MAHRATDTRHNSCSDRTNAHCANFLGELSNENHKKESMQGREKVVLLLQLLPIYLLSSFNKVRYIDYLKGGIRGWTKGQIARKVQVVVRRQPPIQILTYDGYEDLSEGDLKVSVTLVV